MVQELLPGELPESRNWQAMQLTQMEGWRSWAEDLEAFVAILWGYLQLALPDLLRVRLSH